MGWEADAHRDWHTVNGWNGCPWDCYEAEARMEAAMLASMTQEERDEYLTEIYGPQLEIVPVAPAPSWIPEDLPPF